MKDSSGTLVHIHSDLHTPRKAISICGTYTLPLVYLYMRIRHAL